MQKQKKNDLSSKFKVNEEIKIYGNVRIVGEGIESRVIPISEARKLAEDEGLDLVLLHNKNDEPVLKLCNYEKMLYELKKAAKKNRQSSKPMKEIQLRTNIADHDLMTKVSRAKEFIEDGSRVRVVLTMKGRELSRREENKKPILKFILLMEDVASAESLPRDEGNRTSVILRKKQ